MGRPPSRAGEPRRPGGYWPSPNRGQARRLTGHAAPTSASAGIPAQFIARLCLSGKKRVFWTENKCVAARGALQKAPFQIRPRLGDGTVSRDRVMARSGATVRSSIYVTGHGEWLQPLDTAGRTNAIVQSVAIEKRDTTKSGGIKNSSAGAPSINTEETQRSGAGIPVLFTSSCRVMWVVCLRSARV